MSEQTAKCKVGGGFTGGRYQCSKGVAAVCSRDGLKGPIPNYISSNQGEFRLVTGIALAGWVLRAAGLCPLLTRCPITYPLWVLVIGHSPILPAQLFNLSQTGCCGFGYTGPMGVWDPMLSQLTDSLTRMGPMYSIPWEQWWWLLGRGVPVKVGLPDDPGDAEEDKPEEKGNDKDAEDADGEDDDTQAKGGKSKGRGKNDADEEETPKGKAAKRDKDTSPSTPATSGLQTFTARMKQAGLAFPKGARKGK